MAKLFGMTARVEPVLPDENEKPSKLSVLLRMQHIVRNDIQNFYDDPHSFLEPEQDTSEVNAKYYLREMLITLAACAKEVQLDFRTVVLEEATPTEIEYVNKMVRFEDG